MYSYDASQGSHNVFFVEKSPKVICEKVAHIAKLLIS